MKKDNKKTGGNSIFIIVLLVVVAIIVLFFPKINKYIEALKLPKVSIKEKENKKKDDKVDEDILNDLHYPIMRNSVYNSETYYKLDKFKISDMSNSDILYNAFLDIYEGNMTAYNGSVSCTDTPKEFNQDYIDLRIKNTLGKDVSYTLENFDVPSDSKSNYKGLWLYDATSAKFIYNGLCNGNVSGISYYNLEQFIKANYSNDDIIVYKYVGFAKVEGNNYVIYNDASMTKEILSGVISDLNELNSLFKQISKHDKKIYKYTFKDTLCSYNEYCLYEGEWVNEL